MDKLCDFISNLHLGDKRNMIVSIMSGTLLAIGWWIAIDAACQFPSNTDLLKGSHACGAIATLALIMVNSVTNSQIRGESMYGDGGCFNTVVARIWVFIAFLLCFGSLIGAGWLFFDYYIAKQHYFYPGLAILIQNVLIFASTILFKFGRSEDAWQ